jgi:hypothetical protein
MAKRSPSCRPRPSGRASTIPPDPFAAAPGPDPGPRSGEAILSAFQAVELIVASQSWPLVHETVVVWLGPDGEGLSPLTIVDASHAEVLGEVARLTAEIAHQVPITGWFAGSSRPGGPVRVTPDDERAFLDARARSIEVGVPLLDWYLTDDATALSVAAAVGVDDGWPGSG